MLEEKINAVFGDDGPSHFGSGWWSGVLSTFFGLLALGAVVCLHFPQLLTSPELRSYYPMPVMRGLIQGVIVAAIVFGLVSAVLRRKKILALTGMLLALVATLLGGSSVPINGELHNGPAIGLDWFLLDMLLMTLIFSPIEVLWPAYPRQRVFRPEWLLDIKYFLSTHLPIQITSFLILLPATQVSTYLAIPGLMNAMDRLPWLVQFFLAILLADLCEYAIHRAFHKVPFLWRFHAIHHSSKALDWIAGSRSHLVDDVVVRAFMLVPMMLVFPHDMIVAYLFFVTIHATWAHCNFGPTVKWLEPYLIQPRFHHWHHTSQKEALDKNFAIHFPWIDKIFGTHYLPEQGWPKTYGLHRQELPGGFWAQAIYPFGVDTLRSSGAGRPKSTNVSLDSEAGGPPSGAAGQPIEPGILSFWMYNQAGRVMNPILQRPTGAFVSASWAALFVGGAAYLAGLWNADMQLNEKGYYFTILMYGLFSAVSLQKSVRDRIEAIPVTGLYFGLCWVSLGLSVLLLTVGLWNAKLAYSEKGFYAMSFLLSLFGAVAVQKNVRDIALFQAQNSFHQVDAPSDT